MRPSAQSNVIPLPPAPVAPWQHAAELLWPAWQSLARWEGTSADELGSPFGELVVLLWSLRRFGGAEADPLAGELPGRMREGACDPLLEDLAECAFALGAGWAEARQRAARS